jgi:hypothetical protein
MKSLLALIASVAFIAGLSIGGLFAVVTTSDAATAAASQDALGALTDRIMTPMTTGQIATLERNDCESVYGPGAKNCR